jgi:protein kinase A
MEIEPQSPRPVAPQRPLRVLEDEQIHLQRAGLRLTDFEVRGTLG